MSTILFSSVSVLHKRNFKNFFSWNDNRAYTYLCQGANCDGVDELVNEKDHLFPVANEGAKLASSS